MTKTLQEIQEFNRKKIICAVNGTENYEEGKMSKGKIFTAEEVQTIIAGNKRMFREVIKPQPNSKINPVHLKECNSWQWATKESRRECPYQKGQKIFVKESFNIFAGQVADKQSLANAEKYIWKPAKHMKQEHSRLTLQIKEIKVERLKDISKEDAIAEGMFFTDHGKNCYGQQEAGWSWKENKSLSECLGSAYWAFANKWNSTHKKEEHKWESNPFVWSIQFEVVSQFNLR